MFQHNFSLQPCLQPLHPVRPAYPPPRTSSPVGSCGIRACGRGVFGEGERDCLECERERDAASRWPYRDWDDSKTARGKVEWGVSRRRSTGRVRAQRPTSRGCVLPQVRYCCPAPPPLPRSGVAVVGLLSCPAQVWPSPTHCLISSGHRRRLVRRRVQSVCAELGSYVVQWRAAAGGSSGGLRLGGPVEGCGWGVQWRTAEGCGWGVQ
jgi:hypothetical protein